MRTSLRAKVQTVRSWYVLFAEPSPPIRSLKLTKGPPNLRLLHLITVSVFSGISGNLSSTHTQELKFPDIPKNTVILTSLKPPPFAIVSGARHELVAQLHVNIPPYLEKFYIPPSFLNILPSAISNNTKQHGEKRRLHFSRRRHRAFSVARGTPRQRGNNIMIRFCGMEKS